MSTLDLVVILLGIVALGAAVALTLATVRMRRVTAEAELLVEDLQRTRAAFEEDAAAAFDELHRTVVRAGAQVDEVEALVDVAHAIGGRVDAATDVTYRALTSPVIKTVALASGTRRAARRLRPGRHDDPS
ncbi:MAG TPA: hypothetical protein PKA87_16595 [Microthrixaceae bacterium]|nr:hypothetical protein [Microthrixaceae bacterium]HMY87844.1 hypothetical protein [Microthrixaceae bacterium]HNE38180.1 hypothetical protein [Microthrixaceae bacterium]HNE75970.1 hypothetical protein [Microthrixaceae bacterium]HNL49837.1 hypothetical protein [Microthrixaceae bacterium]